MMITKPDGERLNRLRAPAKEELVGVDFYRMKREKDLRVRLMLKKNIFNFCFVFVKLGPAIISTNSLFTNERIERTT